MPVEYWVYRLPSVGVQYIVSSSTVMHEEVSLAGLAARRSNVMKCSSSGGEGTGRSVVLFAIFKGLKPHPVFEQLEYELERCGRSEGPQSVRFEYARTATSGCLL